MVKLINQKLQSLPIVDLQLLMNYHGVYTIDSLTRAMGLHGQMTTEEEEFINAVHAGDIPRVREALQRDPSLANKEYDTRRDEDDEDDEDAEDDEDDEDDDKHELPLLIAMNLQNLELVRVILDANPDITNDYTKKELVDVIDTIFANDDDTEIKFVLDVLPLLIEKGASTDVITKPVISLLHPAIEFKNTVLVKLLLENGADLLQKDGRRKIAFEYIDANDPTYADTIATIKEYLVTHPLTDETVSRLFDDVADNFKLLETYLAIGLVPKDTDTFTFAIEANNHDIIRKLLQVGIDVNMKESNGIPPIHYVRDLQMLQLIIDAGADINAIDSDGYTLLMRLVTTNSSFETRKEMINLLLQKGVDVNIRNELGKTALDLATDPRISELLSATNNRGTLLNTLADVIRYRASGAITLEQEREWLQVYRATHPLPRIRTINDARIAFSRKKITASELATIEQSIRDAQRAVPVDEPEVPPIPPPLADCLNEINFYTQEPWVESDVTDVIKIKYINPGDTKFHVYCVKKADLLRHLQTEATIEGISFRPNVFRSHTTAGEYLQMPIFYLSPLVTNTYASMKRLIENNSVLYAIPFAKVKVYNLMARPAERQIWQIDTFVNIFTDVSSNRYPKLKIFEMLLPLASEKEKNNALINVSSTNELNGFIPLLISAGANVNYSNSAGHTPLATAVEYNAIDNVRALIAADADPNARGQFGLTPLLNMYYQEGFDETTESMLYLLDHGADITAVDDSGHGILWHVIVNNAPNQDSEELQRMLKFFISKGATVNPIDTYGTSLLSETLDMNFDDVYPELVLLDNLTSITPDEDTLLRNKLERNIIFKEKVDAICENDSTKLVCKILRGEEI